MKEETSNDKQTRTEILCRENKSEFEAEAENSEHDSEEDEDSGVEIKKKSLETKSIFQFG